MLGWQKDIILLKNFHISNLPKKDSATNRIFHIINDFYFFTETILKSKMSKLLRKN